MITAKINGESPSYLCNPVSVSYGVLFCTFKIKLEVNFISLLVHTVRVLHLCCSLNQSALGRADNVRKGTKTFSHCCVFLDFNEKGFIFFVLGYYQMLLCLSHMLAFKFQAGCDTICSNSVALVTLSCSARHLSDTVRDLVLKNVQSRTLT